MRRHPHEDARHAWGSFPRQHARTRRFTLGEPRSFRVSPDASRLAFLRTGSGDDPLTRLWVMDLPAGTERCVADPAVLGEADGTLPPEERARRERVREAAGGIVAYTADRAVGTAAFTLGGRLFSVPLAGDGGVRAHDVHGSVAAATLDPTGRHLAYVQGGALHVIALAQGAPVCLAAGEGDGDVTWGLAEFVAAEEMGRTRGHWWAPDGRRLLAARVDERPVARWWIGDPADPAAAPRAVRYPAAGAANADVRLAILSLDGTRVDVDWDRLADPYLARACWDAGGGPLLAVQSRDQRRLTVLEVDPDGGATKTVAERTDPLWVELLPGVPRRLPDGRVLHGTSVGDSHGLAAAGEPLTPAGLHVRAVCAVTAEAALVTASERDPTEVGLWWVPVDGRPPERVSPPGGVHTGAAAARVVMLVSRGLGHAGARVEVRHPEATRTVASHAEAPVLEPRPALERLGGRGLATALLLPHGHTPADGPLPVLMDPYGGPHAQRVLQSRNAFAVPQWFADAGFAVVVADGRGSPGRGRTWEQAVAGDLASVPLEDQVAALEAVAARHPGLLDLDRVAIRGWSFGGFLAALAVLRRPDVFHAAVAGAPVVDWALYDTHYTERYLGTPEGSPEAYRASGLLADAARLTRPLLLVHGLADDNVVAAHTLRLSRALLAAGRPHRVLPLSGVTHMTPQEVVAENLLRAELAFLREALAH